MPFTAVIQPLQMKNALKEENLKAWPEQETGIKTFCNVLSVLQTSLILPVITCRYSMGGLLVIY